MSRSSILHKRSQQKLQVSLALSVTQSRRTMKIERAKQNAEGPFYAVAIEYDCACGLPEAEAPDLVKMSDEVGFQSYFYKQPQNQDEIERAIEAVNVCPIHDLRYCGTDPEIISRISPSQADYCIGKDGVVFPNE